MAVSTIPARPAAGDDSACLGPTEILQLAILGGAARGGADFDELIAATQSLGGGFWQPTREVIAANLKALERQALVVVESHPIVSSAALVTLSISGFDYLAALMRRNMDTVPDPLFHCLLSIKIAFLDLLPITDRESQIEALIDRLERGLTRTRRTKVSHVKQFDHLTSVVDFEENRLSSEIRWLNDFRKSHRTAVAM